MLLFEHNLWTIMIPYYDLRPFPLKKRFFPVCYNQISVCQSIIISLFESCRHQVTWYTLFLGENSDVESGKVKKIVNSRKLINSTQNWKTIKPLMHKNRSISCKGNPRICMVNVMQAKNITWYLVWWVQHGLWTGSYHLHISVTRIF